MGLHMAAVRYVENYYVILQEYIKLHANNPIVLLVCAGPMDKEFYKKRLFPMFDSKNVEIQKVIKHNSPNELFIFIHGFEQILHDLSLSNLLQNAANITTIFSGFLMTRKVAQMNRIKKEIKSVFSRSHKVQISLSATNKTQTTQDIQNDNENREITSIAISSDCLNDSTKINIIRSKYVTNTPLNICIKNNSQVICTIGNTIIDVLS